MNQTGRRVGQTPSAPTHEPETTERTNVRLSPRQVECLRWVAAGKSAWDIGLLLGLSPRTVDEHVAAACAQLGVRGRVQAVIAATALGVLQASPVPPREQPS